MAFANRPHFEREAEAQGTPPTSDLSLHPTTQFHSCPVFHFYASPFSPNHLLTIIPSKTFYLYSIHSFLEPTPDGLRIHGAPRDSQHPQIVSGIPQLV